MDFTGKKVLVTGAAGFIGSHLCEQLVHQGATLRALVHYNSANSLGWLQDSPCLPAIEIRMGDVRDSFFVRQLVEDVDIVFNLAALIAIPYSYVAPASYVDTNIAGALNLCQAALRRASFKCPPARSTARPSMCPLMRHTPCSRNRRTAPLKLAPMPWP